ncbi:hypothetical protein ACHAWF_016191 [Thalassiosira exigua]
MNESQKGQRQISFVVCFLGAASCALTWSFFSLCNFVKFTSKHGGLDIEFGPWRGCIRHDQGEHIIDSSWKASRAMVILSVIFATALFLSALVTVIFKRNPATRCEPFAWILTAIFQGLTLLLLNSNVCKDSGVVEQLFGVYGSYSTTCYMSTGAKLAISAMAISSFASMASLQLSIEMDREKLYFASVRPVDADVVEPMLPKV